MPLTKIRLSHSSRETLHTCDRKFQIDRLLAGFGEKLEKDVFSRGHSFGKGVQVYLLTQNMDLALYQAWLDYWPQIETPPKVSQARTLHALMCAQEKMDELLQNYEIVSFNGQPAIELGYRLEIDGTYYDAGFIDAVLRHRVTGRCGTLEIKYSAFNRGIDYLFKNSGQGIGYSIIIDQVVGEAQSDYDVIYFICNDKEKLPRYMDFIIQPYQKTLRDRLNWFISLGMDVERIKTMREMNIFPFNGARCFDYGHPCQHFGTCHLTATDEEKEDEVDPHESRYSFRFNLNEIIADHLKRTG